MGNTSLLSKKKREAKNQYGLSNTPFGKVMSPEEAQATFAANLPTSAEIIANGPLYNPMNLPEAEVKKMNALGVTAVGATNIITASEDDDDENGDTNAFYYDDNNIFSFTGDKNRGKKPSADLSKLPATKMRVAKPNVKVLSDKDGNDFEYLGQWNGDLSFLDEVVKNIAPPPAGSFLYRKPSGARLADKIKMDYYIGLDPDKSDFFIGLQGNQMFKPIGHKFVNEPEISNFSFGNAGILGNNTIAPMGQTFGFTPYNGKQTPYKVSSMNTNFGNLSYSNNIKPVGLGAFYNPVAIGNPLSFNAAGKPKTSDPTEETSNGTPGTGFEKVANGIAAIATAGAAVINAVKSNRQPNLSVGASNGDLAGYIASQNAGGGFGSGGFGGLGTGGFGETEYGSDGESYQTLPNGQKVLITSNGSKSNTLLYIIAAIAVAGLIFYYIKQKKKP
ncbi:hypothetical protein [Pedobacter jeongneungensis]|uniref:hypothetical protein n=1 Tax=Pedobacter jeongneungensis TaxID=947309 RepID=UPI00046B066B|nr:hypothetical protein [Pedobacter jeongneungensis]